MTFDADILLALLPAAVALLLSALVVPAFVFTTMKDNYGKGPNEIDKTYFSIVTIGGITLFPIVLLALITWGCSVIAQYGYLPMPYPHTLLPTLILSAVGLILLFAVGLKYDLQGSSSLTRLIVIIIAAAAVPAIFAPLNYHGLCGIHSLPIGVEYLVLLLIAAYIIEMVKLLDGLNGLASGTLAITLLLFLLLALRQGDLLAIGIIGAAWGATMPFWLMKMFNKRWRKVIMGNAGAYTMGFILAAALIHAATYSRATGGSDLVVAIAIVLLPALDTLRVIGSRARDSRSIITQDRNQINFKLLRTGLPNGAIFPTYIFLIVFFAVTAELLLRSGMRATIVVLIEVALWVATEMVMNVFIRRREKRTHQKKWDRVYGREAWNANTPYAQIAMKQLRFGTMGLPERFINGDEQAFISDSMNIAEKTSKRIFDICVAALCLILFSPLFLLCVILIKIDDGKDIIYAQERIGRFGRPFNIYKFRTMTINAEAAGPQLSHAQGEDDPRLTKIGRFLRAHHLDELPQLWNVLRGDMSLIGYRPERKFYIDQIMEHDPRYAFLYQIRPGVTSYATLYNGYTDTMEKMLRRLELDLYYLAHRSWWFDCKILFLTFASIVFGKKF